MNNTRLEHLENRTAFARHSCKKILDSLVYGKVGMWILYAWEKFEEYQILDSTVNVLSTDVSATSAQSAPLVNMVPKNTKCLKQSSLDSLTETEDELALKKVGEGLVIYVEESKRVFKQTSMTTRSNKLEEHLYKLGQTIRQNKMAYVHCSKSAEQHLLQLYILEDKKEYDDKRDELDQVIKEIERKKEQAE